MDKKVLLTCIILLALAMPPAAGLSVVSTTSVLWDPIQFIGGDRVEVIYIADPAICPHVQGDIIPNRIQLQREFIANADLFVAINGSVDRENVMPFVEKFMTANGYGNVEWTTLQNPSMVWNTPEGARALGREVTGWLVAADPGNATYYEERSGEYIRMIDAADLSGEERTVIPGQEAIVMIWQREAVEEWLGLSVVTVFGPAFYGDGKFVPQMIVDDIQSHPEKYQNVRYVVENMQSGEMAKGIEEALRDQSIPAKRVVFTNFPKSIDGVDSIPDVLAYNKGLVTPEDEQTPTPQGAPIQPLVAVVAIGGALILAARRR